MLHFSKEWLDAYRADGFQAQAAILVAAQLHKDVSTLNLISRAIRLNLV